MGLDLFFYKRQYSALKTFRKVNFLVKFFEDKGFEVENLSPIVLKKDLLEELLNRCKQVLDDHSKADELLPTRSGFFFGSTNYDEYYFKNVEEVLTAIRDKILPEFDTLDKDEAIVFEIWY